MQPEMQQFSGGKIAPHLSQYKNDISAKQKLIRQRLGGPSSTSFVDDNSSEGNRYKLTDKDNIPSIDDEIITTEQISQERRYKSRFNYQLDDEAEASLQFFKRNLLPNNTENNNSPATAKSVASNRLLASSSRLIASEQADKVVPNLSDRGRPRPLSSPVDSSEPLRVAASSFATDANKYQIGAGKPVPFKQMSQFYDSRSREEFPRTTEEVPPALKGNQTAGEAARRASRFKSSLSRASIEKTPSNERASNQRTSPGDTRSHAKVNQARSIEQLSHHYNNNNNDNDQPTSTNIDDGDSTYLDQPKVDARVSSGQILDDKRFTDSPSVTGSFIRKPLYNSLLRAHDSIRLKVNRPKIRSKSNVAVEDTEIDDAIQLAEIEPSSDPQERAVDVRRNSSKRRSNKKKELSKTNQSEDDLKDNNIPVRNFSEVRVVKIVRNDTERSIGVTVRAEEGNIVVARIMSGSLADKQGALQVGDLILSVNGREVYLPEQLQEQLRRTINDDVVIMKIVPSFREELPTLCIYLRALFGYDANEDSLLPCKEVGVSFNQGDILEVVNQEDPNWWQARRVDSENLQTGLIPSQELEERRRAFVIPDYDLATRTSICGTKVSRKSKKKEIYNVGQNSDFDRAELQLYEEVCRTPAFERRTLVLVGASGVGKQALKNRLITMDPERFGTPLPHTSRLAREGEEDGVHYHFVTRETMEEDIIDGKYLEFGEYDGALYGTKLDSVREIIGSGKVCVLDCSATCLKILKSSDYLPFVAFIAAPTLDQLRYMNDWARSGNRNYTTLDRALSRQSRRARTLQDFAFDFFEDEDLQVTVEESARLFRVYENYFDIVLVNNNFERTFEQLKDAIDALSMAPQWIPISWIYGT